MAKHKILRDPDNLHAQLDLKRPDPGMKLALGLDLGSNCGIAYTWFAPGAPWLAGARPIYGGQLDLSAGDHDSGAIRFVRLRQFLTGLDPDLVALEDAAYFTKENFGPRPTVHQVIARTARAIELLGSFKCTIATWCEERNVPCIGYPIGTIKRRATGLGNANKEAVIAAANAEFGLDLAVADYDKLGTDNIADAIYVLALVLEQYSRGVT
jgi:Holliday junction resolvasome RuvABC endonuclease subunit